ncbi:MAG TPA: RdgB/HAM1 family non-canonical purine NTP pyrophosphatase [Tepidisphaeraceae bacterium]|nr:RdgB/HAM1 family non-canonical purine NTP pyrophosphatase [Tepidisphaeraceae bacterium]
MKPRLLVATTNIGKAREFREMLGDDRYSWDDLSAHPNVEPPEETGLTFRANAMLKASYYAKALSVWAMADDSGLEVAALSGKPGVHSARWALMNSAGDGDAANNALLLRQMAGCTDRSARFCCVLALCNPLGSVILTTHGTMQGKIVDSPRGFRGFGYDPLFMIDELGMTTAELHPDEKHRISHRGRALRRMSALIEAHLAEGMLI